MTPLHQEVSNTNHLEARGGQAEKLQQIQVVSLTFLLFEPELDEK